MKHLSTVQDKIQHIKEYNGLSLKLYSNAIRKRKDMFIFEVSMVTNFQNMELYKLESLKKAGIIERAEVNGINKVMIYFK